MEDLGHSSSVELREILGSGPSETISLTSILKKSLDAKSSWPLKLFDFNQYSLLKESSNHALIHFPFF